jgi:hypothetical protein
MKDASPRFVASGDAPPSRSGVTIEFNQYSTVQQNKHHGLASAWGTEFAQQCHHIILGG